MVQFVVTLGIDYSDGKEPGRVIWELTRGDEIVCKRLMHRLTRPSDDRRTIEHWWLQFGLLSDWENFVSQA